MVEAAGGEEGGTRPFFIQGQVPRGTLDLTLNYRDPFLVMHQPIDDRESVVHVVQ